MLNENMQFDLNDTQEIQFSLSKINKHSARIHDTAIACAKEFLTAEAALLTAIIEVDRDETYRKFGEAYLTPYCEKYLGLSGDVAGYFVRVARKSQQVPALQKAVDQGLSVTKARTIVSVLTPENHAAWIEKAQTLPKEKLEKEVAKANPSAKKPDRAKPTGENRTRLEFELDDEEMALLKRATDLISRKLGKSASLAEVQRTLLENFLDRHDPLKKAERASARKQQAIKKNTDHPTKSPSPKSVKNPLKLAPKNSADPSRGGSRRPAIPADVRHQVNQRDRGQCQAKHADGTTCLQTRWVDLHHLVLKSRGGTDTPENLTTLCSAHHRMWHESLERD